jgi:small subunit ribosomal protein S4e
MGGVWAPKPSPGPHKQRECVPVCILLRERLKYALTGKECMQICMERCVKVDGKVRTDHNYPTGIMDVIELEKSGDRFRLLMDTKGRFVLHRINKEEATYKLCRVVKVFVGAKKVNLETGKMTETIKFELGAMVLLTKGHNAGRVGTLMHVEKHEDSYAIVTVKDAKGHSFATRISNVFVIGTGNEPQISLPKGRGIKKTIIEEREEAEAAGRL